MRQIYNYIEDHIHIIATILMLWLIPDFLFAGWIFTAHAIVTITILLIVFAGVILDWGYDDEPCEYCEDVGYFPDATDYKGFAINGDEMMFSDNDTWYSTTINYCPMCGRRLEQDDV